MSTVFVTELLHHFLRSYYDSLMRTLVFVFVLDWVSPRRGHVTLGHHLHSIPTHAFMDPDDRVRGSCKFKFICIYIYLAYFIAVP